MTVLEAHASAYQKGIALLQEVHGRRLKAADLAALYDAPRSEVSWMVSLSKALFGPLDSSEEAALRRKSVRIADEQGLSLGKLRAVNAAVNQLASDAGLTREQLRLELHQVATEHTADRLKGIGIARVRAANGAASEEAVHAKRTARFSRNADAAGLRRVTLALPDRRMRAIETSVHIYAKGLMKARPDLPYDKAIADALEHALTSGGSVSRSIPPTFIVTTDDLNVISSERVDEEMVFTLNDGSQATARELIDAQILPYGWAALYHDGQPVDLYRTQRLANFKQRFLLTLEQILCAHPDCDRPAIQCEAHHIKAWSQGGPTNLANLTALCSTHNAMNDDDPTRPRNGHAVRDPSTGAVGWQPPEPTKPVRFNDHPVMAGAAGSRVRGLP